MPTPRRLWAGFFVATTLTAASAQPYPVTKIAEVGQPIPGAPGLTYGGFSLPVINSSGQVAFVGNVTASASQVMVGGSVGSLQTIIRPGAAVQPGIGSGEWAGPGEPFIADDGRIGTFAAYTSPGLGTVSGFFHFLAGDGITIADNRLHLPDLPAGAQIHMAPPLYFSLSRTGVTSMRVGIEGAMWPSSNDSAIWIGQPGNLPRIATTRLPLPASPSFAPVFLGPPRLNDAGDCAFYARSDTMVTIAGQPQFDQGVWVRSGGTLTQALRVGQQAPGMPAGTLFRGDVSQHVSINKAGQIAALGLFANYPGAVPVGQAIWAGTPSQLAPVARSGQAAPGSDPGSTFATLFAPLGFSDNGAMTFSAGLNNLPPGSNLDHGLWMRNGSGEVRALAIHNAHAPGSPSNILFGDNMLSAINPVGEVVFTADLHPFGSTQIVGTALYFTDGLLPVTRIFQTGDTIQLAPGDLRTLASFSMVLDVDTEFGQRSGFNSARQLALRANFTNGTTALIITQVPAPGAGAVILAMGGLALRRRCRGR